MESFKLLDFMKFVREGINNKAEAELSVALAAAESSAAAVAAAADDHSQQSDLESWVSFCKITSCEVFNNNHHNCEFCKKM